MMLMLMMLMLMLMLMMLMLMMLTLMLMLIMLQHSWQKSKWKLYTMAVGTADVITAGVAALLPLLVMLLLLASFVRDSCDCCSGT